MRALSLFAVFAVAKALILCFHPVQLSPLLPLVVLGQDAAAAIVFAIIDWLLLRVAKGRPWPGWVLYACAVLYTAINVSVARVLATPLTWPMLRAARGTLADSIRHHLSPENLIWIGIVLAVAIAAPWALRKLPRNLVRAAGAAGGVLAVVGPVLSGRIETEGAERNALAVLVTSFSPRIESRALSGDWRESPFGSGEAEDLSRFRGKARGRNVVLVMLESTGSRSLKPYGALDDPMPELTRLAQEAWLFETTYCVYPESIKGLFSVLTSVYPALDTKPEVHGKVRMPSIATVLSRQGYRTGLFHSGRFMYLGMESIVRDRGFDVVEDAGDIGGDHNSSFGIDEPSAVRRVLEWIDSLPKASPFFAAYLPIAGHHPYETPRKGPFPDREEPDRYKNALHYSDEALAQLLDGLRRRGLHQNTIFLFAGDHGEAFNQHEGNYGHTFFVWEENVRVPCFLLAPGIIVEGLRVRRTASLIDAAPTILDLLGLEAPVNWQGRSLLDGSPRTALFFTDYSLALAGLRDGDWKAIHEIESGRTRLFDLRNDPHEREDVSSRNKERAEAYRRILLDWCGAQRARIAEWSGQVSGTTK